MSIFEELRNDVEGIRLLRDWLGPSCETVSQMHAENRADSCLHGNDDGPCPFNRARNWWNLIENTKSAIAETIRAQLELKRRIQLRVPQEDDLDMCSVCGCGLPLKIWVPKEHIKAHTTPERLAEYPPWCWQKQEIERT